MNILSSIDRFTKNLSVLIPEWLLALAVRVGIFIVFWNSAQSKIEGGNFFGQKLAFWNITDSTMMLFEYDYTLPFLAPNIAAYTATAAEFFLSLGVLFGLFTRLSAMGLLIITLLIQIFVYPNYWSLHILWAALLMYLVKHGAANLSLDALILRRN